MPTVITTRSPYIARTSFTLWQSSYPLGTWAAKKYKTAYTLVSDFGPGHDAETAFSQAFKAAGGSVVANVRVPLQNPDWAAYMQRVKDANALEADLFLSIHHDSVPARFKEKWEFEGEQRSFSDRFSGYSVFVSRSNPDFRTSFAFAELIGCALPAPVFSLAHRWLYARPAKGVGNRGLAQLTFMVTALLGIPTLLLIALQWRKQG